MNEQKLTATQKADQDFKASHKTLIESIVETAIAFHRQGYENDRICEIIKKITHPA